MDSIFKKHFLENAAFLIACVRTIDYPTHTSAGKIHSVISGQVHIPGNVMGFWRFFPPKRTIY